MKTLTILLPTGKPGKQAYFFLNIKSENFLKVIELEFKTIDNLLKLEKETKLFEIQK
jgi:hypothetical protein